MKWIKTLCTASALLLSLSLVGCGRQPAASEVPAAANSTANSPASSEMPDSTLPEPAVQSSPDSESQVLSGWWLQVDTSEPISLAFGEDGTLEYYEIHHDPDTHQATVGQRDTTAYTMRDDVLCIQQITANADKPKQTLRLQVTYPDDAHVQLQVLDPLQTETELRIEGTYEWCRLENLDMGKIRESLNVPDDLEIQAQIGTPYFHESFEEWEVAVDLFSEDGFVAGAAVDSITAEVLSGIYMFSGVALS